MSYKKAAHVLPEELLRKVQVEKRDSAYFFGQQFLTDGAEISSETFLGMSFLISV